MPVTINSRKWEVRFYSSTGRKYNLIMYLIVVNNSTDDISFPVAITEEKDDKLKAWHSDGNKNVFTDIYEMAEYYRSYVGDFETIESDES